MPSVRPLARPAPTVPDDIRRARLAVAGVFFAAGFALAAWVVNIPAVQEATGISHATLGGLLLVLGAGSVVGLQSGGLLIDRVGSRTLTVVAGLLLAAAVNLPGLAGSPWALAAALAAFGLANGLTDVAMNDQAVLVERRYPRPVMSSFHACWSVGGAVGAGVGALVQRADLPTQVALGVGAVVTALLVALSGRFLVTDRGAVVPEAERGSVTGAPELVPGTRSRLLTLAVLAFLLMLAEGAANDWSALQAVEDLGQREAAGSLAYGAFAVAMTVGRFASDPVVHRVGRPALVRWGSLLAAVGVLVVVLSRAYPLTLVGWVAFGLGLSGIVPQIFTTAGNLDVPNRGVVISRVMGAGYVGILAGPAVVGWLAGLVGLTHALLVPVGCCVVALLVAHRAVAPAPRRVDGAAQDRRVTAELRRP
ncbi:MFS transporter [Lapillicoccus jejuensis]|uniref:Sugar phosphate permease n=1 Tax=Lapillicoccus jejuensis TaxID=402171 RepID=A0A542E106_9MICO|nr:MFS transporter [Lapillicoccus jejuensis]TQJ09023.1 sugar phosphate permease [Lapillicoccus jejuensis]